ncbi:MAG: HAD-IIB family hydrolase [Clostridia bacterium]|nr:HAD-IIB family hydrolase [Clostridia bacterium]
MKLLVLDIDGTLVNSKKEITPATISALSRWRAAGNKIAIATGRPTAGVREVARHARMAEEGGYILSYNGACITDAATGERVSGKFLAPSLAAELAAYVAAYPELGIISYEGDVVLSLKEPDEYIILEAVAINKMELRTRPDLPSISPSPCTSASSPLLPRLPPCTSLSCRSDSVTVPPSSFLSPSLSRSCPTTWTRPPRWTSSC